MGLRDWNAVDYYYCYYYLALWCLLGRDEGFDLKRYRLCQVDYWVVGVVVEGSCFYLMHQLLSYKLKSLL